MAIRFYEKIGKMSVKRPCLNAKGEHETRSFNVSIWDGNCLAVFNTEDEHSYYLYNFFADDKHVKNILKEYGNLFGSDKVTGIELNMYFHTSKKLLNIFVKNGYKVKVYYKEPKTKK